MRTVPLHTLPFRPPANTTQRRVWLAEKNALDQPRFNLSYCWRISGRFDPEAFRGAVAAVVARHDALRTTFAQLEGHLLRVVHERLPPTFTLDDDVPIIEITQRAAVEADECIDLINGPMMRCRVLRHGPQDHTVVLTTHHIAVDGRSMGVVREELAHEYGLRAGGASGEALPTPEQQFGHFASWHQECMDTGSFDAQLRYWKRQLAGIVGPVELPFAKPRPAVRQVAGRSQPLVCPPPLAQRIRDLAASAKVSLSTVLMAGVAHWLAGEIDAADVVIGMPVGGRSRPQFDRVVGLCTNTIPLRVHVDAADTPVDLLDRVRAAMLDAQENQDVPQDLILHQLRLPRSLPVSPLSQVLVALRDGLGEPLRLPDAQVESFPSPRLSLSQDLAVELGPLPDGAIGGVLLYPVDLVEPREAERIAAEIVQIYEWMTTTADTDGAERWHARSPAGQALLESDATDPDVHAPAAPAASGVPAPAPAPRYDRGVRDQIARIWRRLLDLPEVRDEDHFFALGGDSLLGVELMGELTETVGVVLPPNLPSRAPTLAALAEEVTERLADRDLRR